MRRWKGVVTVLIVDDHGEFRRAPWALLEAEGFEVVGEAVDGESALAEVMRLRPHLVLLDIQLPDIDGFVGWRRDEPDLDVPPSKSAAWLRLLVLASGGAGGSRASRRALL